MAAAAAAPEAPGEAPTAAAILGWAAAQPGERVQFVERRSNKLLSEPMTLEGYVSLSEDGTLERVVEQPFPETATINGSTATLTRDGRVREVKLDRRGPGAAYLRALYALLRGDTDTLQQNFDSQVTGSRDAWELTLSPTRRDLERWLTRVRISGSGEQVTGIRMERSDGAWQDLQLLRPHP